ncbi:antitoxin VbhA family protein [Halalkalibacillus halophilus]|uniref:antitoxin VbhA family protein n=1 Tax=Halalkalibacillus halophilus TaxID=392827 RepID=UPI0004014999|nr:antitoxin VbhA family protein [Halalkalibacillus halophilus]
MTAELQKYFRSAKASVEMEGFEVTEQMEKLIMKRQSGAISNEEFRNKALRMAGI